VGQARRDDGRHILPFDEYRRWLADAIRQITSPFAATYIVWLRDNHGKLRQLLFSCQARVKRSRAAVRAS
jgi:hypothetical protein